MGSKAREETRAQGQPKSRHRWKYEILLTWKAPDFTSESDSSRLAHPREHVGRRGQVEVGGPVANLVVDEGVGVLLAGC